MESLLVLVPNAVVSVRIFYVIGLHIGSRFVRILVILRGEVQREIESRLWILGIRDPRLSVFSVELFLDCQGPQRVRIHFVVVIDLRAVIRAVKIDPEVLPVIRVSCP